MNGTMKGRVVRALSPTRLSARVLMAVAMAGVLTAACDVHGVTAPGTLASISVSPNATLVAGANQQMTAVGRDAEGKVMSITPTWSVAASGGTVASAGLFTAGTLPGLYSNTVVASVGDISGNASITVTPGPLATITVIPTPVTLAVLGVQQFIAVGKDASGNVVSFTPTWSVVAGGGAINQSGTFTAGGTAGTYTNTVQASSNTLRGFATVIVTAGPLATIVVSPNPKTLNVGLAQQFTATGTDASGNAVAFTPVWTVAAGGGTISSLGVFTAGTALGTFANTVKATSGTASGTATVIVTAGALATITVTPNPATMVVGGTRQLTAVGRDAGGNIVLITPVWDVVTTANGASITQSGMYTAGTLVGTFVNKVRASSGGVSGFATMISTTGALASITVTPNPVFLATAGAQQFTAVGHDANGNVFQIIPTWSVVNGGGSIDPSSGMFTAGMVPGAFTGTVVATSGAISGSATVNVEAMLASIVVSPNPVSIVVNGTQQYSAVGRDMSGNIFPLSPVWSVVSGGGSINASTGLFTAGSVTGTYANTVKATSGTISGVATVTVTALPPVLASIEVTPTPVSLVSGTTQQFAAIGRDGSGNVFSVTPVWSVVSGGGTIDAGTGLFTAGALVGIYTNTVKATSGLISGTATVTVTALPPTLATITVTPNPASMLVNATQQFAAVGRDGSGNIMSITPVWTVVSGGGTINGATGQFLAGAVAGTFTNTVRATSGLIFGSATVTITVAELPPLVDFGLAAPNGIMAGASVTCSGLGIVNADISISPGSTMSGFGPCVFTGVTHLGDATAALAQIALTNAYNTLMGQPCSATNTVGTVDQGGKTLAPGVYCSGTTLNVTGALTLDGEGDANATFVLQAGSALNGAANITLIRGAQAKNVYWVVGSSATLNASAWQGNIVALTSISLKVNTTLLGRALARNGSVTLDATANVITLP